MSTLVAMMVAAGAGATSTAVSVSPLVYLPPGKSVVLLGNADPVERAGDGRRERRACELRTIVLLRQVRGDQVLEPRAIHRAQQIGRRDVVEMALPSRNAALQHRRIIADSQQLRVVIAFDDERVAAGERLGDERRRHS